MLQMRFDCVALSSTNSLQPGLRTTYGCCGLYPMHNDLKMPNTVYNDLILLNFSHGSLSNYGFADFIFLCVRRTYSMFCYLLLVSVMSFYHYVTKTFAFTLQIIQGVPGSNLSPETRYPEWGFTCFSSVIPHKWRDSYFKLGCDCFLPSPFQFIIHLSPTIWRCIVLVTEIVSLNKLQINKNK
jgi:hypothetical protein